MTSNERYYRNLAKSEIYDFMEGDFFKFFDLILKEKYGITIDDIMEIIKEKHPEKFL